MRNAFLISSLAFCATIAGAQGAELTVDRIFRGEFTPSSPAIHWSRDGLTYYEMRASATGGTDLVKVDAATGAARIVSLGARLVGNGGRSLQIDDFSLSADESQALLFHDTERVWRDRTRGSYTVLDLASQKLTPVSLAAAGKGQMFAKLSPDGRQVAFVRDRNLFVRDLRNGEERALTSDGGPDIINGTTDWVYEEELGLRDAFSWSPDSRHIAFWHFDESKVPLFPITDESGLYPVTKSFHYPKAGEPNAVVRLGVMDVGTRAVRWLDTGSDTDVYLPRMEWIGPDSLSFQRLARRQNRVELLMASASTGGTRVILADSDSAYVDVQDPKWIRGNSQLLWLSDRSGWRQALLYNRNGSLARKLTPDGSDVVEISGVDERNGYVYAQLAAPDPTQRQIFRYRLDGAGPGERVTTKRGSHQFEVSPGGRHAVDTWSTNTSPPTATLYEISPLRRVRVLEANAEIAQRLSALSLRGAEFMKIPSADGRTILDAYRMVPPGFDSTRKYPVLIYVYGVPGTTTVADAWGGSRQMWFRMMTQKGYIVMSIDNRGTAWRGRDFRKITQYDLGTIASDDQIAAAKWIGSQRWADPARIGIWGWSGGGYMTAMSIMRGGNIFRMGISVAPVSDWRLYDTIYTERYMWTPQGNPSGYSRSSPLNYVNGLTARYLIVHGTADDNVHFQNSMQLAQKLELARKQFLMEIYPGKTHSLSGAGGTIHLYDTLTRFVLDNL